MHSNLVLLGKRKRVDFADAHSELIARDESDGESDPDAGVASDAASDAASDDEAQAAI